MIESQFIDSIPAALAPQDKKEYALMTAGEAAIV
jgi:hypothetical protein